MGASLDLIGDPWGADQADAITVDGGYTPGLVQAAGTAVVGALLYGFHLGNMNSAAAAVTTPALSVLTSVVYVPQPLHPS